MMRVLVIGVGNRYRRDDAAGLEVAARVRATGRTDVEVHEHDGEPGGLLDLWTGADLAYVVDAVRSGEAPGTIHRFDVGNKPVPDRPQRDGTHAIRMGDAVELARALDRMPRRLVLVGIEGADFGAGDRLSPAVAEAAARIAKEILTEVTT